MLMHHRLSVVDLSPGGRQPMVRDGLSIVFNGEIYNFLELRRVLEEEGFRFSSNSDTEVILAAYERWGSDCLGHLHGMFAFALWDRNHNELLLARDRLGKKPLFYYTDGRSFLFGSEIKAVLAGLDHTPELDPQALDEYLTYFYAPYPKTIFRGILQLPPGNWMKVKLAGGGIATQSGSFWDPLASSESPEKMSFRDVRSRLQDLVAEAVRCRLVSDVPLGVLLSGGMDSSTITAMMARSSTEPVRSFSIGFPQNSTYDEIPFAEMIARQFGCRHEVLQAEPSCANHLAKIVWHFDQPFGNPTAVLTYILSALTKQSVTVALAGDGGDELFGGYPRYVGAYMSNLPRALPGFVRNRVFPWIGRAMSDDSSGRHQLRRLREFLEGSGMPLIEMYLRWIGYFSPEDKAALYTPDFASRLQGHDSGAFLRNLFDQSEGLEPLNRLAYVDVKSFLCCNVLEYGDRMSMAHALELRAPFTDHRLVEFCLRLPFHHKFRYGESKWILKQAMKPFLPDAVLNKRKLGFNPPVGAWLNGELRNLPQVLLSESALRQRGLFRSEAIQKMIALHSSGKRDHSLHIWALVVMEIWFRIYIDGRTVESVQEDINAATFGSQEQHVFCARS
jgi:asparagine synthase (glutamine-hydrolysing)